MYPVSLVLAKQQESMEVRLATRETTMLGNGFR